MGTYVPFPLHGWELVLALDEAGPDSLTPDT